eukprot:7778553-Heterocapsa_arctica.AAC.1
MGDLGATAGLAWPAHEDTTLTAGHRYFQPDVAHASLAFVCVLDYADFEAMTYVWRSPLWQRVVWGGSPTGGVVAVPTDAAKPLLEVAARAAFWSLGTPVLRKFAEEEDVQLTAGEDLFVILSTLVQHILKCTDAETLDVLRTRLANVEE